MRIIILLCLLLSGCATHIPPAEITVREFYQFYLNAFVTDSQADDLNSSNMQRYVAKDTLARLKEIRAIYEQEIVEADYFTYSQDYAAEWIPALEIGKAKNFENGKVIDVWLGMQGGHKYHLIDYLRLEDGVWKIYRVRGENGYEQNIFDDKAIESARNDAATITR
ncbi:YbjP/YqhG family protein [Dryocola sp. BD626]|uniref:YbjP/YqhG family protein n=1 Tax=Dryocola sp. BD626 TaxID=3133273 RepID=UPI003F4FD56A